MIEASGCEMPESLAVFVTSMETYLRFADYLPVNEHLAGLSSGERRISETTGELDGSDYFGVMVRLMLQRKYFQRSDGHKKPNPQFVRNLIKVALEYLPMDDDPWGRVLKRLDEISERSIQVSLPDGTDRDGYFCNAQDVAYGALLHADADKIKRIIQVPETMQTAYVGEYVMLREGILCELLSSLYMAGVEPLRAHEGEREASVRWGSSVGSDERAIVGSPRWAGLTGRDITDDEAARALEGKDADTLSVLLVCVRFFSMLREDGLDVAALGAMVAPWTRSDWGDFSDAARGLAAAGHLGISNDVQFRDDRGGATIKLVPDVEAAFLIDGPQMIRAGEMCLANTSLGWKVMRVSISRD